MPLSSIWEALGGLGLFILGMKSMSEGLQKLAGDRLRKFLEKTTGNRLTAALTGSCLASLLQSSSAASILVIGFVNAGLVSLYQALAVLLGTGIGSSLAIQFIAFKISNIALPAVFIGIILKFFGRKRRLVYVGDLLLGAGLVFLGLQIMEEGLTPISHSNMVQWVHSRFFAWRIVAVFLGAMLTLIVQSSSAATGIVIALASSGLITYTEGVAVIVGGVIGTATITAVATINGTSSAKRTALLYFVMNIIAVALVLLFFPLFLRVVTFLSPGEPEFIGPDLYWFLARFTQSTRPFLARHLANAHTIFNVMSALLFLPLIGFFARSADRLLPGKKQAIDIEPGPRYIDARVINTPPIALLQAKNELRRMAEIASAMFYETMEQFNEFDAKRSLRIKQEEEALDVLQREISGFLVLLSRRSLNTENSLEIPVMLQITSDLEHMGDQCETILDCLYKKKESKVLFSGAALSELKSLAAGVAGMLDMAIDSFGNGANHDLENARARRDSIRLMVEDMNGVHMKRLTSGKCTVAAGMLYNDIVNGFTKIVEYCFGIIETEKRLS